MDPIGYREILIDSSVRSNGTNNAPYVIFPIPIQDIVGYSILSAEIPNSWYMVRAGVNDVFQFQFSRTLLNSAVGTVTLQVRLPSGTYPVTNLMTYLNDMMGEWPSSFDNLLLQPAVLYDSGWVNSSTVTGGARRVVITATATNHSLAGNHAAFQVTVAAAHTFNTFTNKVTATFTLTPTSGTPTVSYQYGTGASVQGLQLLGFTQSSYTGTLPTLSVATAVAVTSEQVVNVSGPNYLMVRSSFGTSGAEGIVTARQGYASDVICKIPINTNFGNVISYVTETEQYLSCNIPNATDASFRLTLGDSDETLDLNGLPFSLKLGVLTLDKNYARPMLLGSGDSIQRAVPTASIGSLRRR